MIDKVDLKNCPFCGGKAEMEVYTKYNGDNDYVVNCTKCGATVPIWHETEKAAARQ
ncbi:CPXCG motif-containing cysteine-rich protein [Ruminococcus champanellensis]|nr:CPXCG motif-containing cysteine-rich protein [Ruminococcus champanellensis]